MGPICRPETSTDNCHTTPRNIREERRSQYIAGWSSTRSRRRPILKDASGTETATPRPTGTGFNVNERVVGVIADFRRGVNQSFAQICALLGCYAASCGNPLPTFRDNVSVPLFFLWTSWTFEGKTDKLSRNFGNITRRCLIPQKIAELVSIAAEASDYKNFALLRCYVA
jgi:hypothetical protein